MAKRIFKTERTLTTGRTAYRKWSEWSEGDVLIGKLISVGEDQYEKPNYVIQVEDAQFSKPKEAKALLGKKITLNSAGQLDKAMAKVEPGEWVQITYNGTSEIEKGKFKGKDAHLMDVVTLVEEGDEADSEESEDESEENEFGL